MVNGLSVVDGFGDCERNLWEPTEDKENHDCTDCLARFRVRFADVNVRVLGMVSRGTAKSLLDDNQKVCIQDG